MAMPGMGTSPGTSAAFPALAVVLALFMLGYVMWATDQLASLARAKITTTIPARIPEQRALAAVPSGGRAASTAGTADTPHTAATEQQAPPAGLSSRPNSPRSARSRWASPWATC